MQSRLWTLTVYAGCAAACVALIVLLRAGYGGPVSLLMSGALFLVPVSIATWFEKFPPQAARWVWGGLLVFALGLCVAAAVASFEPAPRP